MHVARQASNTRNRCTYKTKCLPPFVMGQRKDKLADVYEFGTQGIMISALANVTYPTKSGPVSIFKGRRFTGFSNKEEDFTGTKEINVS